MASKDSPGGLLGPLKVIACNGRYCDPAVQQEGFSQELATKYIRTADASVLPLREGAKPVLFHLHRLPASYLAVVTSLATVDRQRIAALLGSLRLAGREGETPLIEVLPPKPAPPEGARWVGTITDGCLVAPTELVQEIADEYGYETVQQLGHWALEHAQLPRSARGPFSWWGSAAPRL